MGQRERLIDTIESVPADLMPLIEGFLTRRSAEIPVLREHIIKNDLEAIKVIAHRLKGNGASFGFPGISQLGAEMEGAANGGASGEVLKVIERLETVVRTLRQQLG